MAHEHYARPVEPPAGWQAQAFLILWGLGFGSAVFFAPLIGLLFGAIGFVVAGAGVANVCRHYRGQLRGLRLDDTGLTIYRCLVRPRHHSWTTIREVEIGDRGVRLDTLQGTVRWDTEVLGWRRLGLRIQEALGQGAAAQPQGEAVDPTVVAGWLGIAPDGYLECRPRGGGGGIALVLAPAWLLVTAALVAFYRPFFAGVLSGDAPRGMRVGMLLFTTAHASIFFGTFSGGLLLTILRALRPRHGIRADVAGLHVRGLFGWRFHAWDDIASVVMQDGRWQVAAGDDELVIEPSWQNASPLVRALQQALAARRDGRALPRGGPIPDAALSLARDRGEEAQAERGLSVADG